MSKSLKYCPIKKKTEKIEVDLEEFNSLSIENQRKDSDLSIKVKSILANQCEKFDQSLDSISSRINQFKLIENHKSQVYELFKELLSDFGQLILAAAEIKLEVKCAQKLKIEIDTLNSHAMKKLNDFNTRYKRKKQIEKNPNYVAPVEKAIGLKWSTKQDLKSVIPDHNITQATFQYIGIIPTLKCLFNQPDFRKEYFDFNQNSVHECQEGVYEHFCCSQTYKNCELFADKSTIKIRLATDDCEICDPLKTKNIIHKLNCVYFTVDNMPQKFLSKTDNLFLVSLCETTNLKIDDNTFDEIGKLIVNEMNQLENVGIKIGDHFVKGGLARIISDNLGANGVLGYTESFNSFFCRLCEVSKGESQQLTRECPEKMRTKESYQKCIESAAAFVDQGKPIDLKVTKGIKRACIFNDLQTFHVLDNICLDVMHDVNEGLILFFLSKFFEYCDTQKIMKKNEIQCLVRDFNYGVLHKQNKPSLINFDRPNLGQNATQSYFIMIHLPFIFKNVKYELESVWISAESLLKMMQIIYSTKVCDDDITNLSSYIEIHYESLLQIFNAMLLPKHHLVSHYPNAFRAIGPLINYWMMRFENKHTFFTNAAHNTKNFVNIAKTLANKHQEVFAYKSFVTDEIEFSKRSSNFLNSDCYDKYIEIISNFVDQNEHGRLKILLFAKYNSFEYREGLFILSNNTVYEIMKIFSLEDQLLLFCVSYKVVQFDAFYNSIEIEKEIDSDFILINIRDLKSPSSYERKISENKIYLICKTLEFKHFME